MNVHTNKRRHHNNGMQNRRPQGRYNNNSNGGSGGGGNNANRPRKNYAALREKYLNQARDAMASGDRVLAEYYLQYADHYYRMQAEFMEQRTKWREQQPQQQADSENPGAGAADGSNNNQEMDEDMPGDDNMSDIDILPNNSNVLPAFLTRPAPASSNNDSGGSKEQPQQNWEEE